MWTCWCAVDEGWGELRRYSGRAGSRPFPVYKFFPLGDSLLGRANTMTSAPFLAHNDECHIHGFTEPKMQTGSRQTPFHSRKSEFSNDFVKQRSEKKSWLILTTAYFIVWWLKSLLVLFSNTESKWFVVCFKIALATNSKYYFVSTVVI